MESSTFFDQWPPHHHAYAISSIHTRIEDLKRIIATKEVSYIYDRSYDVFTIGDARMVKQLQSEKTDVASVFILSFSVINHEAQNALLKVLEEPAKNTYFFLLYPNFKQLLPTLQSRLEVLDIPPQEVNRDSSLAITAHEFIALSLQQRFTWIKDHTDVKAGENKLTKEQVKQLLYGIEQHYENQTQAAHTETLKAIYEAQRCINANGASIKMVLDMVAVYVDGGLLASKAQ